jgi:hypothetical protein
MLLAAMQLAAKDAHCVTTSRMKRVQDLHLKSQTPGIMTLARLAPARPILPSPLPEAASAAALAADSIMWSIWSIGSRPRPATDDKVGLLIT